MNTKSITSVTFILTGNTLTTYGSIGSGWTAAVTAIFGLVIFFIGLGRLKADLDSKGQSGISLFIWSAIIGIIANIFALIPLVGFIPAAILSIVAFILEIAGLLKLKHSTVLGNTGAGGANTLLIAMVFIIVANIFGIIPLVGGIIKDIFALVAFIIIPFGWIKIQEAIIENKSIV